MFRTFLINDIREYNMPFVQSDFLCNPGLMVFLYKQNESYTIPLGS